jgi:hypothetical protein
MSSNHIQYIENVHKQIEEYKRQKEAAQALIKELDDKIETALHEKHRAEVLRNTAHNTQLLRTFDNQLNLIGQLTEKVKDLETERSSHHADAIVDSEIAQSVGIKKILLDNQPLIQQYIYLRTALNRASISNEERTAVEPHYLAYRAMLMRTGINPDAESTDIILDN